MRQCDGLFEFLLGVLKLCCDRFWLPLPHLAALRRLMHMDMDGYADDEIRHGTMIPLWCTDNFAMTLCFSFFFFALDLASRCLYMSRY